MSDTADYGSGLNTPIVGGGSGPSTGADAPPVAGAAEPTSIGGAPLQGQPAAPPQPSTPSLFGTPDPTSPQPSQAAQPQSGGFGAGLKSILPGPQYDKPDPASTALDQSASLLQQRITRASSIAANPIANFFDPEGVAKARAAVPQMTEQLQTIQQQKAKQTEIKQLAANYGINNIPQGADRETATNMMADELQARYLKGDPVAATALTQLGRTDLVQAGGEQALSAAAANNQRYRDAFSKLAAVRNPGEYDAAYQELQRQTASGMHADHELASVPKTFEEFQEKKQMIGNSLSMQQLQLDSLKARMQQLGGVVPIQKQVDKDGNAIGLHAAISSQVRDNQGNTFSGIEPVTVGGIYNGNRWSNGSAKIGDYGTKWGQMTNEELKTVGERIKPEATTVQRAAGINKLNDIASQKDFGTNAWLLGHGIDQFVEISRNGVGGKGSATPGTIQIMENLRGHLQTMSDQASKEWGRVVEWVDGGRKGPQPYMSPQTISGLKDAITTLKTGSDKEIGGVAGSIAGYVGNHGGKLEDLGLEPGVAEALRPQWQAGNTAGKQYIASLPAVVVGNQRVTFDPAGVKPPQALAPGGFDPATQQPAQQNQPGNGAAPAPLPGGGSPPPAGANPGVPAQPGGGQPPSGGPGGGGQPPAPVTIAGQNVPFTPPPGATSAYLPAMQRVESGNEKNAWTSTTPGSSASGAYQMIDSTWMANRPLGATALRAKDATPEQQTAAIEKFTAGNAAALKNNGLPVNDNTLYIAHNLGPGGASSLLHAAPNADARTVVGEAAAKNNPLFFKGKPTVATVLARYAAEMNGSLDDSGPKPQPGAGGATASLPDVGAAAWTGRTTPAGDQIATPEQRANSPVVNNAPAIGSTIGAIAGGLAGGGVGGVAGGGVGGGAGQTFQNYMQGKPQDPVGIAKQAALGAALGVAPEAGALAGAATRAATVGGVNAGFEAAQGGDTSDIIKAGGEGVAYALGGEALGRFVSSAGATAYKALSRYTTGAQSELSASAGKLAAARETLNSEAPKLPGEGGANPKYEAAKKQAEEAEAAIKDHGQNPDDMVHAYEQAKAGVSSGEAAVTRGAVSEKRNIGEGYDDLRKQVTDTGVGAPKPNQAVPQGPVSQLRTADNPTGKVPEQFRPEAEHAEMLIKAPAPNFGVKWSQLQDAGSELIQKRLAFLANGDKPSATAMDELFKGVRNQQKAVANYVFGAERGPKIIGNLEELDTRYAKVMNATAGMDFKKMQNVLSQGNTPQARELEANFKSFAKGDPTAVRAFNAMKAGARGDWKTEAALMAPVIAGEVSGAIPAAGVLTAAVGGYRLVKLAQGWMNARILGKAVTFKDFLAHEAGPGVPQPIAGGAQRAAVQGPMPGAAPGQ